ncbi:dehydrogenase [Hornefia porci]|uniref:Dehydrogenase n=1 Tax=Hornefia porci TaxID=2652292 RepID=A0A1Q9JIB1_9FIRM|nr:C-terminal binding protein [Hornefia porci]OLR55948.1 dehydrogenase [Hornefia porci]
MNKVIITDCDHSSINIERAVLREAGIGFDYLCCRSEEDLIRECRGGEVMLNQYAPFTERVIAALSPELKLIVRYGVGVDNIDVAAATKYGVAVCNVPDYGMNEVADHAAAMALSLERRLNQMVPHTRSGQWDYAASVPIHRLSEQTIGIVGLGRIGRMFARRMSGFGCRLIGFDEFYPAGIIAEHSVVTVTWEQLIAESDLISIHCPLTESTRGLFNADVFSAMKPGAYLINTSRGHIVDEQDLLKALQDGEIAGAAMDVMAKEPADPEDPLLQLPNFIATPHMGWYSEEAAEELKRKVAEEAVLFLTGRPLRYQLNKTKKEKERTEG